MLKKIVVAGMILMLFFISNPAFAWGVNCPDPSIPGTWTLVDCEPTCNFGVILCSESVLVFLSDQRTVWVTDHPDSWEYFGGDFFIFEKPDANDLNFNEDENYQEIQNLFEDERIELLLPNEPTPSRRSNVRIAWW